MGILLSCCDDLNLPQKRKQFERAIPVLLQNLALEYDSRRLALFIAELVEAVRGADLEFDARQALRFVEKTVAVTCRRFEENPLMGAPIEDWLVDVGGQKQEDAAKERPPKPEEKLEDAWFDAVEMVKRSYLPDRKRTNLIANWILYDRDGSGDLSALELRRLLHALNFDDNAVSFVMQRVASLRKLSLTYFEFADIFDDLLKFPELEDMWQCVAGWQDVGDEFAVGAAAAGADRSKSALSQKSNQKPKPKPKPKPKRARPTARRQHGDDDISDEDEDDDDEDNKKVEQTADFEEFCNFLVETQKEPAATVKRTAEKIIDQLGGALTKTAFVRYLTAPEINHIFDPARAKAVYHDMAQPICHYFINSSHNTYLTGNQLSSNSDANMYRKSLREGCRSVEIDCWDGPFGRPIVYHGFTRTSKISFDSVIHAINETAFETSPFPVTISFELHVSLAQQDYMVDSMLRIFGDKLAKPTWAPGKRPPHTVSPASYRRKILVKSARFYEKTGPTKAEIEAAKRKVEEDKRKKEEAEALAMDPDDPWAKVKLPKPPPRSAYALPSAKKIAQGKINDVGSDAESDDSDSSDDEGDTAEKRAYQKAIQQIQDDPFQEVKKVKSGISPRLSALVVVEAKRCPTLSEETFKQIQQCTVTSFSENRSRKLIKTQNEMYRKLLRRQIVRVYPHAARFNSSNFHPQEHWNVGAHMVAMNWQTEDAKTRYAKARFTTDNGGCGYLLKPAYLRDSRAEQPTAKSPGVQLTLRILSAFALPKPEGAGAGSEVIDPYVVALVEGPFMQGEAKQSKTSVIDDNGFHPVWKGSGTEMSKWHVPVPEMSTLILRVFDEDVNSDDFIAEAYIPVDKIRSGCRCVGLYSEKFKQIPNAFLVVQVLAEDRRTKTVLDPNRSVRELQNANAATAAAAAAAATAATTTTTRSVSELPAAAAPAPTEEEIVTAAAAAAAAEIQKDSMLPSKAPSAVVVPSVAGSRRSYQTATIKPSPAAASNDLAVPMLPPLQSIVAKQPQQHSPRATAEWVDGQLVMPTLRSASPDARPPLPLVQQQPPQQDVAALSNAIENLWSIPVEKKSSARQAPAAPPLASSAATATDDAESVQKPRKVKHVVTSRVTRLVTAKKKASKQHGDDDADAYDEDGAPLLRPKKQQAVVQQTGDIRDLLSHVDALCVASPTGVAAVAAAADAEQRERERLLARQQQQQHQHVDPQEEQRSTATSKSSRKKTRK